MNTICLLLDVDTPIMNVRTSLVLVFVMCYQLLGVWTQYPMCTPRNDDDWEHVAQYGQDVAVENCQNSCRTSRSVTFSGVHRNGPNGENVECYCIVTTPETSVGGCSYRCGGQPCGGDSGLCSVYPVCSEGSYGASCSSNCPGSCAHGVCEVNTGNCPDGCADGRHGAACDQLCGNCINVACDQHDALCEGGCLDGWYTPTCTAECPKNCLSAACDIHDATCSKGCVDGYYSTNCTAICPDNCANKQCTRDSGDCGDGCEDGWYAPKCTAECSEYCGGDTRVCDQVDGTCTDGCVDGRYEPQCTELCSDNCAGSPKVCEQFDGTCTEGCVYGWYGLQCGQQCSQNCAGSTRMCDRYNGTCIQGCIDGWYTPHCTEQCASYCNTTKCGLHDGHCLYGCTSGYYGPICEKSCPTKCSGAGCTQDSGYCYSCHPGYHATLCNETCSANCASGVCNRTDGTCTEGCQCGWSGVYCDHAHHGCDSPSWPWPVYVFSVLFTFILGGMSSFLYVTNRAQPTKVAEDRKARKTDVAVYENCDSFFEQRSGPDRGINNQTPPKPSDVSDIEIIEGNYSHLGDHTIARPTTYDTLNINCSRELGLDV